MNPPLEESDLSKVSAGEMKKKFGAINMKMVEYKEGALEQRFRQGEEELWPFLLGLSPGRSWQPKWEWRTGYDFQETFFISWDWAWPPVLFPGPRLLPGAVFPQFFFAQLKYRGGEWDPNPQFVEAMVEELELENQHNGPEGETHHHPWRPGSLLLPLPLHGGEVRV